MKKRLLLIILFLVFPLVASVSQSDIDAYRDEFTFFGRYRSDVCGQCPLKYCTYSYNQEKELIHCSSDSDCPVIEKREGDKLVKKSNPCWYNWIADQVQCPQLMAYNALSGETIDNDMLRCHINRQGEGNTGANGIWVAVARMMGGVVLNDVGFVEEGMDMIAEKAACRAIPYTWAGKGSAGIQYDWSYFTHWAVPNMHAYGVELYGLFAKYLFFSADTPFAIDNINKCRDGSSAIETFYLWNHNFIRWVNYLGYLDPYLGSKMPYIRNSYISGARGYADRYLLPTSYPDKFSGWRSELEALRDKKAEPFGAMSFPMSNYIAVRRPNFFVSLRMVNHIEPGGEITPFDITFGAVNILTQNTVDRWFGRDQHTEISDKYMNNEIVQTPFRLLNLMTVPKSYEINACHPNIRTSARPGGLDNMVEKNWCFCNTDTLAGYWGMGGENIDNSNFAFKKSWFFFDDEIVSLTSDISGDVRTWINSFKVKDTSFASSSGSITVPTNKDQVQNLGQLDWLYHDNTGYVFLIQKSFLAEGLGQTAYPDHVPGNFARIYSESKEDAALVLLPSQALSKTTSYSQNPDVRIIKFNSNVHAVEEKKNKVVAAAFFGQEGMPEISSNLPAYVMYQAKPDSFRFSLRNPHREDKIPPDYAHGVYNPFSDYAIFPSEATYHNYAITVPFKLIKGTDSSLDSITLTAKGSSTEIRFRLRVYRKLEFIAKPGLGGYVLEKAWVGHNDESVEDGAVAPPLSCTAGNPCTTSQSCPGKYDANCNCIDIAGDSCPADPGCTVGGSCTTSQNCPGTYDSSCACADVSNDNCPAVQPPSNWSVIRVNAGGAEYVDSKGDIWFADQAFNGDWGYAGGTALVRPGITIQDTIDQPLHQAERYDLDSYRFTVENGDYQVDLYFSEVFEGIQSKGLRVFDMKIEGKTVLAGFDIYQIVGYLKAFSRTYEVGVSDNEINIDFVEHPGKDYPKISAIKIVKKQTSDPADLNSDDVVDIFDLVILIKAFGSSQHDLTGDGKVDVKDLLVIVKKL